MRSRKLILIVCLLMSNIAFSQFPNILIGDTDWPEEPSIAINPKNPDRLVAGANIDLFYTSGDGGLLWSQGNLTSPYSVYGDPCLVIDTAGNYYYFHLSNPPLGSFIDRIVCQKSTDGGLTWSDGTFMGLNGTKGQDKEWAVVDPVTNTIYVTWTQFDVYGTSDPADSSIILFSKSTDEGATWSTPKRISRVAGDCVDSDNTDEGAVPAVGPGGEIYVSWAGPAGLVFNRSLDEGATWMDTNVFVSDIPGGWDYAIPGIYRANGLPVTCCDLSNGPSRGTIYINWSDQRNGFTDTDVWLTKSTDGGLTWSPRKRVNDDPPGKQQFFTWMTVDQVTGFIYFVFYDRRAYPDEATDVYMAVSRDGGETFQNFKVSESPFTPNHLIFFGDYTNISAHNNVVRPIWARLDNSQLTVYTALVDSLFMSIGQKPESGFSSTLEQNFPNPGRSVTCIAYKVRRNTTINLEVFDLYGNRIATLVDHKVSAPGRYIENFDIAKYGLTPGLYFYSLTDNEKSVRRKMIVE
ncbi:MAG: T9SS type A sorting domain-containing protein [Bacteroidetes bacterium]|nr:T9SS type A sorting domain-containing protein [Bacteroidota bacterium]